MKQRSLLLSALLTPAAAHAQVPAQPQVRRICTVGVEDCEDFCLIRNGRAASTATWCATCPMPLRPAAAWRSAMSSCP